MKLLYLVESGKSKFLVFVEYRVFFFKILTVSCLGWHTVLWLAMGWFKTGKESNTGTFKGLQNLWR